MSDLNGATTMPSRNAYPGTPGEFAAKWNSWDEQRRQQWLEQRISNDVIAIGCIERDHEEHIAWLESRTEKTFEQIIDGELSKSAAAGALIVDRELRGEGTE